MWTQNEVSNYYMIYPDAEEQMKIQEESSNIDIEENLCLLLPIKKDGAHFKIHN